MKNWSKNLLPLLSLPLLGALNSLAFAPYDIFPFAIMAPACLVWLMLNRSAKQAFWMCFAYGAGFFGFGVYWVYISIHSFGDVPPIFAGLITAGLIAILAMYPAITGYFYKRYFPGTSTSKVVWAFPCLWVLSEILRSYLFTGFPWLILGYSQINSPLRGYAPILSVYGVSLAILLSSTLIVNAIIKFQQQSYKTLYYCLLGVASIWIVGALFDLIPWTQPIGQPLSVALVQGNIPQSLKWSPDHTQLSFDRYEQLTQPLWGKTQLIVWPEAAIPVPLQEAAGFIGAMDDKALATHTQVIMGIPMMTADGSGYYNAIVSLGAEKRTYVKRRLVPFGEYIPSLPFLGNLFSFMKIPLSNMQQGSLIQKPFLIDDVKILPSICYEIAFPELSRTSDKTMGALLTVTNDAWFGHSSAQSQHLQMAQMRALEMRRPMLFDSNDGITAIINANGKIEARAPAHTATVLQGTVQPTFGLTPWMKNNLEPLLAIILGLLLAVKQSDFLAARKQRKAQPSTSTN